MAGEFVKRHQSGQHSLARRVSAKAAWPRTLGCFRLDDTPCSPDFAGSGGGTANPEFVARLRAGDRSDGSPSSPPTP